MCVIVRRNGALEDSYLRQLVIFLGKPTSDSFIRIHALYCGIVTHARRIPDKTLSFII